MGIINFLKPKPKPCHSCQKEFLKLHKYNPLYFEGRETRRNQLYIPSLLCNDCFLRQFNEDLLNYKSKIVFIEPTLAEGYSFTRFKDDEAKRGTINSAVLKTFLPPDDAVCNLCGQPARFTWVGTDVMNDERSESLMFKSKDECPQFKYLCPEHLQETFSNSITNQKLYFMEFWPFKGFGEGYCW